MNYLETGLPHTDFSPKKTDFRPPRYIPLCSLGRKYLGLEPLSRDELQGIISRLCQPKRKQLEQPEPEDRSPRDEELSLKPARRFVGRKRMSSFEIEKMVDRLYGRRKTKDYEFVENTFDTQDFVNMTDRDSEDENEADDDVFALKSGKDQRNARLQRERSFIVKDKLSNINAKMIKEKTNLIDLDIGDSVKINSAFDRVNSKRFVATKDSRKDFPVEQSTCTLDKVITKRNVTKDGRNDSVVDCRTETIDDRLKPVSSDKFKVVSHLKQQNTDLHRQQLQTNSLPDHSEECPRINPMAAIHRNVPSSIDAGRRVPRLIKTADPWSRRTETMTRQVNRVRRPLSNPMAETNQASSDTQTRVLNLKLTQPVRPEYTLTRSVSNLPALQSVGKPQNAQPSNYQPPTEDDFIDQVASSNTPRQR